jgi:hypothetical protein
MLVGRLVALPCRLNRQLRILRVCVCIAPLA